MHAPLSRPATDDRAVWTLLFTMVAVAVALQPVAALTVVPATALLPGLGLVVLLGCLQHALRAGAPRLLAGSTAFLQMTLFTLLGILLSYTLAARGGPLWDARFAAWDEALGLDWPAIRAGLDRAPALVWLLGLAYYSLIPQMIVAIVGLSGGARYDSLRLIVCASVLAGFATILISGLTPSLGNLFDADRYRHLWPAVTDLTHREVLGLRTGTLRALDLHQLMGIVTFPSYHAALALIFMRAFRDIPRLAVVGPVWAALTIVATPVNGGHYAVDVLAGLALGALSLAAAGPLVRRAPAPPGLIAFPPRARLR